MLHKCSTLLGAFYLCQVTLPTVFAQRQEPEVEEFNEVELREDPRLDDESQVGETLTPVYMSQQSELDSEENDFLRSMTWNGRTPTVTRRPDWLDVLQDLDLEVGQSFIYEFGETTNIYGETMAVDVNLGQAASFSSFDKITNRLYIHGIDLGDSYAGKTFKVRVTTTTMTEVYEESYKESFDLIIAPLPEVPEVIILEPADEPEIEIEEDEVVTNKENYPVWQGKVLDSLEPEPYQSGKPLPYIAALSETGELTIGWDTKMKLMYKDDIDDITSALIAVKTLETPMNKAQIMIWDDRDNQSKLVALLKPLMIELVFADDDDRHVEVKWTIKDQNEDFTKLQLDFDDADSLAIERPTLELSFWDTDFFMDTRGNKARCGTTLYWTVLRQASLETQDEAGNLTSLFVMHLIALVLLVPVCVLIGQQTPAIIHVYSLQTMVYLVLLAGPLTPGNITLFLAKYLNVFRLSSLDISIQTFGKYDAFRNNDSKDHVINTDRDSLLQMYGYGPFFVSSIPILFSVLALCIFVWLFTMVKEHRKVPYIVRKKCPNICRVEKSDETTMFSFTVRIGLTFFLEICICTFMSLQATELGQGGAVIEWLISVAFLVAIIASLAYLVCYVYKQRLFKIDGYFTKLSPWSLLCWGLRSVDPDFDYASYMKGYKKDEIARRRTVLQKAESRSSSYRLFKDQRNIPQHAIKIEGNQCQPLKSIEAEIPTTERQLMDSATDLEQGSKSMALEEEKNNQHLQIHIDVLESDSDNEHTQKEFNNRVAISYGKLVSGETNGAECGQPDQYEGGAVSPDYPLSKSVKNLRNQLQARIHLELEKTVAVPPRLAQLVNGIKPNHQRRVALIFPLLSLMRLLIFAVIVVSSAGTPTGILLTMMTTLIMLAYLMIEHPWKSGDDNCLQIANESVLYLLCGFMSFFCSVETSESSRLAIGRWFMAAFQICMTCNVLYMISLALKYLRLVLRRRFNKQNRQRLAGEVVQKMKLINRTMFDMAEKAKEDNGVGGEDQNQSKQIIQTWMDKSWFEPNSPLKVDQEKDQKIQMQPKRTAYGGLQGTFILSEANQPLSFDHISSVRDMEQSKQLTSMVIADQSLIELQREFADSSHISQHKHIKQFLTQQFPVETKKERDDSEESSWFSASSFDSNDGQSELGGKKKAPKMQGVPQVYASKRLVHDKKMESNLQKIANNIIEDNWKTNRQFFHSPLQLFDNGGVMHNQPYQGQGMGQRNFNTIVGYQYQGPMQNNFSELNNMTPQQLRVPLGQENQNYSTKYENTAAFNVESTNQLRNINGNSFLSQNNVGNESLLRQPPTRLMRLELNDSSMTGGALMPQRRKEDSNSYAEQSGSFSQQKTFVSNLVQKQEESKIIASSNQNESSAPYGTEFNARGAQHSKGPTSEMDIRADDSMPNIGLAAHQDEREAKNIAAQHMSVMTFVNKKTHVSKMSEPEANRVRQAKEESMIDNSQSYLDQSEESKQSSMMPKPQTDRVLQFFRENRGVDEISTRSYEDHAGIDPFDRQRTLDQVAKSYQTAARSGENGFKSVNLGRSVTMRNSMRDKKRGFTGFNSSGRANSQENMVEPLVGEGVMSTSRRTFKRNALFKMHAQNPFNDFSQAKTRTAEQMRQSLQLRGSEIVQSQAFQRRENTDSDESGLSRDRDTFAQNFFKKLNHPQDNNSSQKKLLSKAHSNNFSHDQSSHHILDSFASMPNHISSNKLSFNANLPSMHRLRNTETRMRQPDMNPVTKAWNNSMTLVSEEQQPPNRIFEQGMLDQLRDNQMLRMSQNSGSMQLFGGVGDTPAQDRFHKSIIPSNKDVRDKIAILSSLNKLKNVDTQYVGGQQRIEVENPALLMKSTTSLNSARNATEPAHRDSSVSKRRTLESHNTLSQLTGMQVISHTQMLPRQNSLDRLSASSKNPPSEL